MQFFLVAPPPSMIAFSKLCIASTLLVQHAFAGASLVARNETESYAAGLLQESMDWMDMYYDNERGYLFSLDAAALTHDTRASAWYAAGLLARNKDDDVEQAIRIVTNIIGGQFKNESEQWYVLQPLRQLTCVEEAMVRYGQVKS